MLAIYNRIRSLFLRVFWSIRFHGLGLTVMGGIIRGLSNLGIAFGLSRWLKDATLSSFDNRFGVNTSGYINVNEMDITEQQKSTAVQYQPTVSVAFCLGLSEININYANYIFIDYGSGKGRALIMAAFFPFKQIMGVEISNLLHQSAMKNLSNLSAKALKCKNIISICEDAITFKIPNAPLVIYFYHPFNEVVLEKVLINVFSSLKEAFRHIVIIYQQPIGQDLLDTKNHKELTLTFEKTKFLRKASLSITKSGWEIYETVPANEFFSLVNLPQENLVNKWQGIPLCQEKKM